MAKAEELLKDVGKVQFAAPAEALGERERHGVAVVDVRKGVRVHRILHMAADDVREAVHGQHGAFARAAAGDDVVRSTGIQQDGAQNAHLHIGQLRLVLRGVHAVVVHDVTHRLDHLFERVEDQRVLGCLAVFVDERNTHRI